MAVVVKSKTGKNVTLLNPSEKGGKFASELSLGLKMTNEFKFKSDKHGKVVPLTNEQRAFRSGYLQARKDSANVYKAKKKRL